MSEAIDPAAATDAEVIAEPVPTAKPNGRVDPDAAETVEQTSPPTPRRHRSTARRSAAGQKPRASSAKARQKGKVTSAADTSPRTRRAQRSFPASSFEEALTLATAIQQFAAGQRVRRLTLFEHLGRSPDSGNSRQLVTNSSRYGLTVGSYRADYIELTPDGRIASSAEVAPRERLQARFRLAIERIAPFKALYDRFQGNKLPAQAVMRDFLTEQGYGDVSQCVDTFVVNAKYLTLLRTIAGAERLVSIEHVFDDPSMASNAAVHLPVVKAAPTLDEPAGSEAADWSRVCFYITPIGQSDSEERKHSDLFLSSIVEPALEELNLQVIRADHIGKPGMITGQVIEHILRARLVVADLSFHNPNVFYELCLRHACRLPTVQLIRECDRIPFDVDQFRTIRIDNTDIYSLVPKLETYRSQVANQARQALSDPESVDNPLTLFAPHFKVTVGQLSDAVASR